MNNYKNFSKKKEDYKTKLNKVKVDEAKEKIKDYEDKIRKLKIEIQNINRL